MHESEDFIIHLKSCRGGMSGGQTSVWTCEGFPWSESLAGPFISPFKQSIHPH